MTNPSTFDKTKIIFIYFRSFSVRQLNKPFVTSQFHDIYVVTVFIHKRINPLRTSQRDRKLLRVYPPATIAILRLSMFIAINILKIFYIMIFIQPISLFCMYERHFSINKLISSGISESKNISFPVIGCTKPKVLACKA